MVLINVFFGYDALRCGYPFYYGSGSYRDATSSDEYYSSDLDDDTESSSDQDNDIESSSDPDDDIESSSDLDDDIGCTPDLHNHTMRESNLSKHIREVEDECNSDLNVVTAVKTESGKH